MAAIAHFIVNFERLLELGTEGIIAEIKEAMQKYPEIIKISIKEPL